jgi:hypothetical protein
MTEQEKEALYDTILALVKPALQVAWLHNEKMDNRETAILREAILAIETLENK